MAAALNHMHIVKILCEAGADCNARDKNMLTPLLAAVKGGHMEAVTKLESYGADHTAVDNMQRGAEYYALLSCDVDMLHRFITHENVDHVIVPGASLCV